jgi:hypothetical protein
MQHILLVCGKTVLGVGDTERTEETIFYFYLHRTYILVRSCNMIPQERGRLPASVWEGFIEEETSYCNIND